MTTTSGGISHASVLRPNLAALTPKYRPLRLRLLKILLGESKFWENGLFALFLVVEFIYQDCGGDMAKKKSKAVFKIYDYEKQGIKYFGKFIASNLIRLKRFSDGREILIDTSHRPYLVIIKFPIHLTQDTQSRKLLKIANTLSKRLIRDMVLDTDGKLMCRPYGAFRADTRNSEQRILKVIKYYFKLRRKLPKDYACVSEIMKKFDMKRPAVAKLIERHKKKYHYINELLKAEEELKKRQLSADT